MPNNRAKTDKFSPIFSRQVWDLSGVCSESSKGGAGTARVTHEWLAHKGGVLCAAFSGNRLYTGGADKVVRVWERGSDGQYAAASVLVGHRGSVCVVKIR
jgi:WD40 repeat protein